MPSEVRLRAGLALAVWLLAVLLGEALFGSTFGITYDEPVYAAVAERHTNWLARVLRFDLSAWQRAELERGWGNSGPTPSEADWHPPVGKVLEGLCRRLPSPFGPYAQFRAGSTFLWAGTAVVLLLWLGEVAGLLAGLTAALAWLTLPGSVLHGNLAALDNPAAFFATTACWLAHRHLRAPSPRTAAAYGLVLGLGLATKFNVILVAPAVLLIGAWRVRPALRDLLWATCLLAPVVFVACWPWLWYDGLAHLRAVIAFHGRHALIATEYFGVISGQPAWHYPFVMLAATTPLATLLAAAWGAGRRTADVTRELLVVALLCHLLPFASPSAAKYNGVRLFLPALPLVAALAGLGLADGCRRLAQRLSWPADRQRLLAALALALVVVPAAFDVLSVHPYPTAFYNRLVGGPAGAARRGLEVSYWGEPFRELLAVLSRQAPPGARVYLHPPGAIAGLGSYRGTGLLRDDLRLVHGEEGAADFFVYQNRPSEWDELGFRLRRERRPIYTATGGDAPVGFIWARP